MKPLGSLRSIGKDEYHLQDHLLARDLAVLDRHFLTFTQATMTFSAISLEPSASSVCALVNRCANGWLGARRTDSEPGGWSFCLPLGSSFAAVPARILAHG
jgi:hypothetical protein